MCGSPWVNVVRPRWIKARLEDLRWQVPLVQLCEVDCFGETACHYLCQHSGAHKSRCLEMFRTGMAVNGDGQGFQVDPAELRDAANRVAEATAPADRVDLSTSGGDAYGVGEVHATFARFCATWRVAIGVLSARAESAGRALVASADAYDAREADGERVFSTVAGG